MSELFTPPKSSWIGSISYDADTCLLKVGVKNGPTYTHEVPPDVHDAFVKAESPGKFYNAVIKPEYPVEEKK